MFARTATLAVMAAAHALAGPVPWSAGEVLHYEVRLGLLDAARAELRAEGPFASSGRPCWRLGGEIRTGPLLSAVYRVRDRLECFADTADLRCYEARAAIQEGAYSDRRQTVIDHAAGLATTTGLDGPVRILPGTHDVLAAWYRARTMPLAVGDTLRLPVFASGRSGWLLLRVRDRTWAFVLGRRRSCLVVDAALSRLEAGRIGDDVRVVITDDALRLPARIEVATPVGRCVAELVSRLPESDESSCPPSGSSP